MYVSFQKKGGPEVWPTVVFSLVENTGLEQEVMKLVKEEEV